MGFSEIQDKVIKDYRIKINEHATCYGRTHAHIKTRMVCKWKRANSFASTFTLLHEVGHIENNKGKMRRAEQEYYATTWAIDRCREFGISIPQRTIFDYQRYILLEKKRGERRGGTEYAELNLFEYVGMEGIDDKMVLDACDEKWRKFILGTL